MREEFEKLAAAGKIGRHQIEPLVLLAKGGFCTHRSWGFGKITTVDTVFCRFTIDFVSKTGHSMDLAFAVESLKPIPSDHILAKKASDLNGLRQMAALHHIDLIKLVLKSFGGQATVEQIQQILVPDVIADDWKKWWEVAKREMKKDGHFQMPTKKSEPLLFQAEGVSLKDRFTDDLKAAKGLKAKIQVAAEFLKNLPDIPDPAPTAGSILEALNADIASHQRTQPALALEAVLLRDEIRAAAGLAATANELSETSIWEQVSRAGQLLEALPAAKHKRGLASFRQAYPGQWSEVLLGALNTLSSRLVSECALLLIEHGHLNALKERVGKLINQHLAGSELLLWLAKERSDSFADILGPEVFRAMLTAMERDQFTDRKFKKLRDFILSDPTLLVELIGSADLEVIKDLTRALQLSPCFDDMDKRSLLARIVKSYPTVQSLISGEASKQEASLVVSWESLERRKNEYADLVQKKIPANSKEIAIARSYGDLRENHEYKAAKEMQKFLMRRKAELEVQLARARGTDFANVKTDAVSIGTKVRLVDLRSGNTEHFSLLGAWDSEPERGIMSYLSPLAQALLNRKPGEEIDFEMDSVPKRYRIEAIEPHAAALTAEMA